MMQRNWKCHVSEPIKINRISIAVVQPSACKMSILSARDEVGYMMFRFCFAIRPSTSRPYATAAVDFALSFARAPPPPPSSPSRAPQQQMAERGVAGGGAAAAGAGGRAAAAGGGERYSTTHHLVSMQPNQNHTTPLKAKGKTEIILTKHYKVAEEAANIANQDLIDTYNAMWDVGDSYEHSFADLHGRKYDSKSERKELRKCFGDLLTKVSRQKSAVIRLGAEPIPFPSHVQEKLPKVLQDMMNEKAE